MWLLLGFYVEEDCLSLGLFRIVFRPRPFYLTGLKPFDVATHFERKECLLSFHSGTRSLKILLAVAYCIDPPLGGCIALGTPLVACWLSWIGFGVLASAFPSLIFTKPEFAG